MSVVAAAAYGPQLCGSGARKRKDVVHHQEAEEAEEHHHHHHDHGLFVLERVEEEEEERSSIGAASDQEEGDEADSAAAGATTTTRRRNALACMDALDDALPIKRGLSNFFSGKSRSFASLQDAAVTTAQDLAKPENPFNKRRRVLRCSSIRRVASTPLTALPPFLVPPAAAGNNDDDDAGYSG